MEIIDEETVLAYTNDIYIVILGITRQKVTYSLSKLETSENTGLCINERKTKCLVLSRRGIRSLQTKNGNLQFGKCG